MSRDDESLECGDDYPMPHGCICGNDCKSSDDCRACLGVGAGHEPHTCWLWGAR